ncbi:PLP-dependent aminotransferase family protein [Leptospira congkakensis]|uniref:HTH-type transcriptional regulator NorG n=1 Tax=Leptospira congkakensis TaxID=2484932 RepID=A0A4Z1AMG0_9LEPT|nr:PLP-dependent aminotransferase family protein [Leptospira congkakensis]TGL90767.1 PLP-dependent aminotransferase family protein [Leptospira congkakensis]TGL91774.1 PLP-dependent aminotransferase family protein [Leptospira congkakensis]TGL98827.1 PLP-dependent aminotransferase family protein [Leptospira congkakensis]
MTKYKQLAEDLKKEIQSGYYSEKERIPSLREIQNLKSCSLTTAKEAYRILEEEGYIYVVPQSGYFVHPNISSVISGPQNEFYPAVEADDRIQQIMRTVMDPKLISFGAAIPSDFYLPLGGIVSSFKKALQYKEIFSYGDLQGNSGLRDWISKRISFQGYRVNSEQIQITSGCTESITFSLLSVTEPGDTVIVPSPIYVGLFQILETLKLKVVEIPYRKEEGISADEYEKLIKRHKPKVFLFSANFNNPNGILMSETSKQSLAKISYLYGIHLVEDDIYGDLYFWGTRPKPLVSYFPQEPKGPKSYLCSSFSKTLAPGLRIGWVASKTGIRELSKRTRAYKISENNPTQMAVLQFLKLQTFERHLKFLRSEYKKLTEEYFKLLSFYSEGILEIQKPEGGFVLWIKSPLDGDKLLIESKKIGMAIAPGSLFGLSKHWDSHFRLNVSVGFSPKIKEKLIQFSRIFLKKRKT